MIKKIYVNVPKYFSNEFYEGYKDVYEEFDVQGRDYTLSIGDSGELFLKFFTGDGVCTFITCYAAGRWLDYHAE